MRLPDLLRSIDGLSYGGRVRFLADHAPQLAGLLGELGRGSSFERVLGLQIAEVTRDAAYVSRMLRDREPAVQARALAAVGRGVPVTDDDLRILYDDAPAALRSKLVALVRRQRREHLAVRLIDEHRARWGDVAATGLLDAVDDETVARLLPELAYCVTPGNWRRLAKHHREQVLAFARATLPAGEDRAEWWQGVGHAVAAALDVELLEEALPAHDLPAAVIDVIGPLADRDPAGVLALLLAPDRRSVVHKALTPALRRRLYRYSDDELVELGRVLWPELTDVLRELAPGRRGRVFEAVTKDVDLGQAELPSELLRVLPHAVRVEQARRMLALPAIAEDGARRRRVTAHLPYDDARASLSDELRDPDAGVRSSVYQAVLRSATRPEQVVAAVTWAADRVRNDQDLVRLAVLHTVADVSPTLLTAALTVPFETLLEDALNARDTSWATRRALGRIAERAVVHGALGNESALLDWGLRAHARLAENLGEIALHRIVDNLPRGREAAVYDVLRPAIEASARRLEFGLAFAVAEAFGRRAWRLDHLQDVLEQAVWSNQEHTVERACRYWLDAPSTRSERVERIIRRDVRLARWHPVWWLVTEVRTDLLDPVFEAADSIRRFDRNSLSWEVPDYALRLWLPRQQARYASLLAGVARDPGMPQWYRAAAVKTLGRVPSAGRPALDEFLASEDVLLQEAALGALAWTGRPELAMPLLLSRAGDDRARVAMYAASRAARYVPPSLLPGLLQPVLSREGVKVTARKQAVRLLGELRAPGAGAVLTETWAGAHRDVRAAIARTVSQYLLYDPAAWAVLEQAVHDSPATAVVLGARSAYDVPLAYRSRYADLLIAVTTRSEPEVVGPTLLALRGWARYSPAAAGVCADFVTDLSLRSRVWSDAITALVSIVASDPSDGVPELVETVRLLVRLEEDPALPDAAADRDHPARQRLARLVGQLTGQLAHRSAAARSHLSQVAAELTAPDYLTSRLQLLLLAAPTPADAVRTLREVVGAVPAATGDDVLAAAAAAELLRARLRATESNWSPAELLPPAESLSQATDPASGLLAHALLSTAGPRAGWPPAWRRLLVALRNNPSAFVRRAALELVTAAE
ncbi:HEAT repeat domain-containing protein [Kribbella sp. NPDC051137]|uniref:HEAT repeat domain-containing protein n=1 Tax=Kribbella sp. NPDC051137 TaxID=3155045 RepID=UPI002F8FAE1E